MMSNHTEGLSFSEFALLNRPLFLSVLSDINIYVEDVGKEYEYEEILERLFCGEIGIFSVYPLGGKEAVLKAFSTHGTCDSDGKVNVYILDGDFDILWDDLMTVSPNVIYLSRYNIESYYCTKDAVLGFMRSYLRCMHKKVKDMVDYDMWKNNICREIGDLFICFAIVKRKCPQLANVQLGTGKFLDENGRLKAAELSNYRQLVQEKLGDLVPFTVELTERIDTQQRDEGGLSSIICGKYQLESICRWLKSCCNKNVNRDQFRSSMISHFDLQPLMYIKDQITRLVETSLLGTSDVS